MKAIGGDSKVGQVVNLSRAIAGKNRIAGLALLAVVAVALAASLGGCRTMPKGDWYMETGRARVVDDRGQSQPRIEAVAQAQYDACLKILRRVEAMTAPDSNLVGDHMAQDALFGARIRSLILSARRFDTRYKDDGTVEVDMGVNLDDVRRILRETGR